MKNSVLSSKKSLWQKFENKKSDMTVFFVMVYSVFSLGAVVMEKFADQNCLFWNFFKKSKNGRFSAANFGPLKIVFSLLFTPIFSARPRFMFWTPKSDWT